MAYDLNILPDEHVVQIEVRDELTGKKLRSYVEEVYEDRTWTADWDVIWDFRPITSLSIDYDDLLKIVRFKEAYSSFVGEAPDVHLVMRPGMDRDIAHLYSKLTERQPYKVNLYTEMEPVMQEIQRDKT